MRSTHLIRGLGLVLITASIAFASPPTVIYETMIPDHDLPNSHGLAVDTEGHAYCLASTYDDGVHIDILVIKLNPDGTVAWTQSIQGDDHDYAAGIAIDPAGDVWITGFTDSTDFPLVDPMDGTPNGFRDAFLTKLSASDGSLLYSTLIGGDHADAAHGIAIAPNGEILLAGSTKSRDFPTVNAYQSEPSAPLYLFTDAFVTRLAPSGDEILYSTYLGGLEDDEARFAAFDSQGNMVLSGYTEADDFPLVDAIEETPNDLFVAKLSADGSTVLFGTYLGGEDIDYLGGMALDSSSCVYLTGGTRSIGYPTTPGAFQEEFVGEINGCEVPFGADYNCEDIFVTKLSTEGDGLIYSSFIGGSTEEFGRAIAVNNEGCAHVAGYSYSDDFPPNGIDFGAAIVLCRLSPDGSLLDYTYQVDSGSANRGNGLAIDPVGDIYLSGTVGVPASISITKLEGDMVTGAGDRKPITSPSLTLLPAAPNPFNPITNITYVLPEGAESARASLRIYDIHGHLVQDLVSSHQSGGRHVATWYGRTIRGLEAPSGVYFHRLTWNGQHQTGRMVLVR